MKTILALLCPPVAVLLTGRPLSAVLTLALTLLFWLPGMAHAMMIVSQDFRAGTVHHESAPRESPAAAWLALIGLLFVMVVGVMFWPSI